MAEDTKKGSGAERRRNRRLKRVTPVLLTDPSAGIVIRATTEDVSLFGYGLRLDQPFAFVHGQTVHLCFEESFSRAEGKVAWSYIQDGILNVGLARVPAMKGDLETHPLSQLFLDLRQDKSSGILRFTRESSQVTLYLDRGILRFATSTDRTTGLARILYRLKRITTSDVADVEHTVKVNRMSEQVVLLEKKLVKPTEMLPLLQVQAERTVAELFSWESGTFTFEPQPLPEGKIPRMSLNEGRIVTAGMRRISGSLLTPYVPPGSTPLTRGVDPFHLQEKARLKKEEEHLFSLVDGHRTAEEILKMGQLEPAVAQRALGVLLGTLLVEPGEELDEPEVTDSAGTPGGGDVDDTILAGIEDMHHRSEETTFYELLGVESSTPADVIKQNFYRLARQYHPDQHRNLPRTYHEKLHEIFTRVQEAYSVLSDERRRKNYDREVGRYAGTTGARPEKKSGVPSAEDIFRQGGVAYKKGDFAAAAEAFKWAAKIVPTRGRYHFAAAEALAKLPRQRKEAEDAFLKAIELSPFNADYLVELARLYLNSDLPSRAERTLLRALEIDPDHKTAQTLLKKSP